MLDLINYVFNLLVNTGRRIDEKEIDVFCLLAR